MSQENILKVGQILNNGCVVICADNNLVLCVRDYGLDKFVVWNYYFNSGVPQFHTGSYCHNIERALKIYNKRKEAK